VIPDHFNTFPVIAQDADNWSSLVTARTSTKPVVLKPGESFTLMK
jgi:hypothetical protein